MISVCECPPCTTVDQFHQSETREPSSVTFVQDKTPAAVSLYIYVYFFTKSLSFGVYGRRRAGSLNLSLIRDFRERSGYTRQILSSIGWCTISALHE
jgi:hypothetical protein